MQFKYIITPVLDQLAKTLTRLTIEEYTQESILLNGSSIGGHTRHVIELFQCLLNGYKTGVINYEHRKRDAEIERNNLFAANLLQYITTQVQLSNKNLLLEGTFSENETSETAVQTNYYREIIYNLEHAIHHMALIRVAINEVSNIEVSENFGVAPSTTLYRKLCAQ